MKTLRNWRIKPWELALTAFVMALPFLAPAMKGAGFVQPLLAIEQEKADTSRLVSIGGAITEIIYALNEEKRLVARDSTSRFPPAADGLPDVGYMRALSPEGVLGVDPSAIIAIEGSGPPEALAVLRSAAIPFAIVPEKFDRDGILAKIDLVGAFLGVDEKARVSRETVAADLDAATAAAAGRPETERKRVLFILSLQGGKILASGTGTAADGIVRLAGAVNAVGTFPGYKPLNDEDIVAARPDVILMMTGGGHAASDDEIFAHPALRLTPAASTKAVIRLEGLHFLGFGPRAASAIRALNAAIYGNSHAAN